MANKNPIFNRAYSGLQSSDTSLFKGIGASERTLVPTGADPAIPSRLGNSTDIKESNLAQFFKENSLPATSSSFELPGTEPSGDGLPSQLAAGHSESFIEAYASLTERLTSVSAIKSNDQSYDIPIDLPALNVSSLLSVPAVMDLFISIFIYYRENHGLTSLSLADGFPPSLLFMILICLMQLRLIANMSLSREAVLNSPNANRTAEPIYCPNLLFESIFALLAPEVLRSGITATRATISSRSTTTDDSSIVQSTDLRISVIKIVSPELQSMGIDNALRLVREAALFVFGEQRSVAPFIEVLTYVINARPGLTLAGIRARFPSYNAEKARSLVSSFEGLRFDYLLQRSDDFNIPTSFYDAHRVFSNVLQKAGLQWNAVILHRNWTPSTTNLASLYMCGTLVRQGEQIVQLGDSAQSFGEISTLLQVYGITILSTSSLVLQQYVLSEFNQIDPITPNNQNYWLFRTSATLGLAIPYFSETDSYTLNEFYAEYNRSPYEGSWLTYLDSVLREDLTAFSTIDGLNEVNSGLLRQDQPLDEIFSSNLAAFTIHSYLAPIPVRRDTRIADLAFPFGLTGAPTRPNAAAEMKDQLLSQLLILPNTSFAASFIFDKIVSDYRAQLAGPVENGPNQRNNPGPNALGGSRKTSSSTRSRLCGKPHGFDLRNRSRIQAHANGSYETTDSSRLLIELNSVIANNEIKQTFALTCSSPSGKEFLSNLFPRIFINSSRFILDSEIQSMFNNKPLTKDELKEIFFKISQRIRDYLAAHRDKRYIILCSNSLEVEAGLKSGLVKKVEIGWNPTVDDVIDDISQSLSSSMLSDTDKLKRLSYVINSIVENDYPIMNFTERNTFLIQLIKKYSN